MVKKRNTKNKVLLLSLAIFALLIFLGLFACLSFFLLFRFLSEMTPKAYSPNGSYYVQVEESNGGATTGYVTDVMLSETKKNALNLWLNNRKDIFITNAPGSSVLPKWIDDKSLEITFGNCSHVYKQTRMEFDVRILYKGTCEK